VEEEDQDVENEFSTALRSKATRTLVMTIGLNKFIINAVIAAKFISTMLTCYDLYASVFTLVAAPNCMK
jgi:hypothetical protein